VRGELRQKFFPEFPVAAGKGRGGRYPAVFRSFGATAASGSGVAASFFLRPTATGSAVPPVRSYPIRPP